MTVTVEQTETVQLIEEEVARDTQFKLTLPCDVREQPRAVLLTTRLEQVAPSTGKTLVVAVKQDDADATRGAVVSFIHDACGLEIVVWRAG